MTRGREQPASTEDALTLDRWWANDPRERYWLEVSDRGDDLGVDLNAPTTNEVGRPFWSYDLLLEVNEGDIILHYDRSEHAIVGWSKTIGAAWPDLVVWAARGTFARGRNIQPHERPGRRVSLNGPFTLAQPLTLDQIRRQQHHLTEIRGRHPYFPFELGSRPTRPLQGYLFKLPAAFLDLFPELHDVNEPATDSRHTAQPVAPNTTTEQTTRPRPPFRPRNENVRSRAARPWSRDPSEVDRALSSHARIERLVAEAATQTGWTPRTFGPTDPVFDLLLEQPDQKGLAVVVEAKSTTATNEEKQLRLGLGQVLRYQQLLHTSDRAVVAMVAIERPPEDPQWISLYRQVGVSLVWPDLMVDELTRLRELKARQMSRSMATTMDS